MKHISLIVLLPLVLATGRAELLSPVWIQYGDQGGVLARVVVSDAQSCPLILTTASSVAMHVRTPVPEGFRPACEAVIPPGITTARVGAQHLALPGKTSVIAILGDTGCRIKDARLQSCNDPQQWPFHQIAQRIALESPDLIIHVGDYLYRENACPEAKFPGCSGSPWGDNWETWNADFFGPAADLLHSAPWAFSRGNHEDCERAWQGWSYYLAPGPVATVCSEMEPPYQVRLGSLNLLMLDSSASAEKANEEQAQRYAATLQEALRGAGSRRFWIVAHHPFWGLKTADSGGSYEFSSGTLARTGALTNLDSVDLLVAGHTHLFEFNRIAGKPLQLVAGNAGTALAAPLPGGDVRLPEMVTVLQSATQVFGYVRIDLMAGRLEARDANGHPIASCALLPSTARCE